MKSKWNQNPKQLILNFLMKSKRVVKPLLTDRIQIQTAHNQNKIETRSKTHTHR